MLEAMHAQPSARAVGDKANRHPARGHVDTIPLQEVTRAAGETWHGQTVHETKPRGQLAARFVAAVQQPVSAPAAAAARFPVARHGGELATVAARHAGGKAQRRLAETKPPPAFSLAAALPGG